MALALAHRARYFRPVSARQRCGERVCALDLGSVRVGVAVDDELGLFAHARAALSGRRPGELLASLRVFAAEEDIGRFVVGLPLDMTGGTGDAARSAMEFAKRIEKVTGIAVELWDERLTTVQASRNLAATDVRGPKARRRIDGEAACFILQSWLDAHPARRKL
jgi:putative Holliday junction resolvase